MSDFTCLSEIRCFYLYVTGGNVVRGNRTVMQKVTKSTDWVNSLVTVEKPNGSIRICLDPKDLNDAIKRPHYPNKTLDDILPDLTDAKIFSRFDARSGYWSIVLTEKSSFLTTFQTPFGPSLMNFSLIFEDLTPKTMLSRIISSWMAALYPQSFSNNFKLVTKCSNFSLSSCSLHLSL